jgi:IS30 family transposase
METVNDKELTMIENRLNHRPIKQLGLKTPIEVFHASLASFALRARIRLIKEKGITK